VKEVGEHLFCEAIEVLRRILSLSCRDGHLKVPLLPLRRLGGEILILRTW
jgi:hypothetical protein